MEVILLENIKNLGKFGKKVQVAKGFGRNYLIPQGKAVPATTDNIARFESQRADLEKAAMEKMQAAHERAAQINSVQLLIKARAADEGKLYGSIGTFELAKAFQEKGIEVAKHEIRLPNGPMRELGEFTIELHLHSEVNAKVKLTIAPEEEHH